MILAVTMNPSVDISYPIPNFMMDDVNRVEQVRKTAGGKGLNVARVIRQMDNEVVATGVLGGTIGDFIIQELTKTAIANDFFKIDQESRNCIAILHDGKQTEILESGPTLTVEEGAAFIEKYKELLASVSIVTLSGSLPNGLTPDYYRVLVELARDKGTPVIVDTSGEALRQVLLSRIKPYTIKPNLTELSNLLGKAVESDENSLKQALESELFEGMEMIVVSLGADGAFVKHGTDHYRVTNPRIKALNPVGSGDATVAGLAVALSQGLPVTDVLKTAMTTGMLNAMESGTGMIDYTKFDQFFELVQVTKLN